VRRQSLSRRFLAGLPAWPASAPGAADRLRIARIELFQVAVPMQPGIVSSRGCDLDILDTGMLRSGAGAPNGALPGGIRDRRAVGRRQLKA
jgi:hypothetical protein